MKAFPIIVILVCSFFMSCYSQTNDQLLGKWYHFREQDKQGEQLFVKKGSEELPPARFRQYFYFKLGGVCEYNLIAPTDGRSIMEGSFRLEDEVLLIMDNKGKISFKFDVIESSVTKMKLSPKN